MLFHLTVKSAFSHVFRQPTYLIHKTSLPENGLSARGQSPAVLNEERLKHAIYISILNTSEGVFLAKRRP